jgi:CRP-like cAMP-binding protein
MSDSGEINVRKFLPDRSNFYDHYQPKYPDMQPKDNMAAFYGLSETDLQTTMSRYRPMVLKANDFFLEEGRVADKLGFVKSGILRAYFYNDNADEITTEFYPAGSLIVSFESFNNQVPSRENIVAVDDSELLVINYKYQKELYDLIPVWRQICKDMADGKSQEMIERSARFQTMTAAERYRQFCENNPEVARRVALRHIASFLGMDIATLSRIRRKV